MIIDDAYLYRHMPAAEMILMNQIPPEDELDHQFSRRFCRKMKALLKYERRTPRERAVYRGMKLAFATLAVILLIVFGSAMTVKAYRFRLVEFIVEVFEDLTSYSVQEEKPDGEAVVPIKLSRAPKGYVIEDVQQNNTQYRVCYRGKSGNRIYFRQCLANSFIRYWDTETAQINEKMINGKNVTVIDGVGEAIIYWTEDKYVYCFAGDVEMKTLIEFVETLIKR